MAYPAFFLRDAQRTVHNSNFPSAYGQAAAGHLSHKSNHRPANRPLNEQALRSVQGKEASPTLDTEAKPIDPLKATPSRRGGSFAVVAFAVLGLLAGLALAGVLALSASVSSTWHRLTGRSTSIDVSAPALIERIQKLSRLETVDYSVDKIVEGDREYALLPNFLTGDKLLLIAHGEVIAGVDLSQLESNDLSVHGDAVTLHLPVAQVLTSRLDNQQTRIYSRTTGLLVSADPNLESAVRLAAEQQLTQAAIAQGILLKARQNAQASLTTLLYGLGFRSVSVT